ncbi:zinc fingers and homeoboxes protein 2 [Xenopus laevis]|uniref:Zinc fingers and homeoboxes protein 2 n=2 Tax=Xenopus laevis TaxID=8355 RepID=A0A1L8FTV3_XENLA|nr:zinc fingers and homeoboxes protein 2 [Xenopus laevis]XP_018079419.1 zinc fingers and homeoboxes protein 2 [Xenopus laevis]XP_018079420.1 zinc fingers and homeoboxes protein 2 [Xenopus laevis]OCT74995.1 hypothetical protein XELAEV_18033984mg [Xenopus laevis]
MASKRKSTTPCMVRASEIIDQEDNDLDNVDENSVTPGPDPNDDWSGDKDKPVKETENDKPSAENQSKKLQGGYECKYCPYVTQNLNEFTEHVDMQHPNVILNPLYVCAECNFTTKKYDSLSDHNSKFHPGENNFKLKLMKRNNQTILEQSIEGSVNISVAQENFDGDDSPSGISVSKMPMMKFGKARMEGKKATRLHNNFYDGSNITETNGISSDLRGDILTHVSPFVQLPPNINLLPKVPVPLNSTKYNSALDTNTTLINSFNKFPYPTQAELSCLTVVSKHPEEQIRIWFATQRLKHGISWSPEEVEEARTKMFNGTIQSVPQTITVLPTPITNSTKISQPLIQTALPCQIIGQTGLVFTQVANSPAATVHPFSANTGAISNQTQKQQMQQDTPESKRQIITHKPPAIQPKLNATPLNERKKTKEQIGLLKASFVRSQFPDDTEIYRLIDVTGLSRSEIKKWFSDHRYRSQRGIVHITSESIAKDKVTSRSTRGYHPYRDLTPQKVTETTEEQLACLESSFLKSSYPTQNEMDHLKAETKMTRKELDLWFSERRKIRDSMEQAVLDSMGSDKNDTMPMNGASPQRGNVSGSWPETTAPCKSKQEQLHLLKSTFARTQWPSPQDYDQLALQTGLVRTEIVKWFKDNRCVLKTGSLRWMEQYRKHYERSLDERRKYIKMISATEVGKDTLTRYFQEYNQLHEEDIELLSSRLQISPDDIRVYFVEWQQQAAFDQMESSSQDEDAMTENEFTGKDWAGGPLADDEAISDGADSWGQAAADTPEDTPN